MPKRPWLKFYPSDWRSDPRLRLCSYAARGLWIDLISYMHEGEPYGHFTIDGVVPHLEQIAALLARPANETKKALAELEDKKIFSRSEAGAIFSRRMVRDKAQADIDRENGKGGGNPRLIIGNKGGVNPPFNGGDKAQILEARKKEEDTADAVSSPGSGYAFESGIIRLNAKDFQQWKQSFEHLDLSAELIGLTEWAGQQGGKWFHAVSGALAKRNREARLAAERAKDGETFRWRSGIEGVV